MTIPFPLVDGRWRTYLAIFVVVGWVNAGLNVLLGGAFLVLAPSDSPQQALLRWIGMLFLALAVTQVLVNVGIHKRAEWARKAALVLAGLEIFMPPVGTAHGVLALWLLRRESALQWFV